MVSRLCKFDRYKDFISIKSWEVKAALFTAFAISAFLAYFLDFYGELGNYVDTICEIIVCLIGVEFGLLGIILAGLAIIVGLVSKDVYLAIKNINAEIIPRLMSQYEFCAICLVAQIVYFLVVPILLNSNLPLPDKRIFYILFFLILYHLFFNTYYLIALLGNCIHFIEIKNKIYDIDEIEKTTIDIANEIRIELLMGKVLRGMEREELVNQLETVVEMSNIENKDEIKQYFRNYYLGK